jgi:hypothetical protein
MTLQLVAVPLARTRRSGRCPIGIGGGPLGSQAVRLGTGNAAAAGGSPQARCDTVYAQCMSAKGNRIPAPRIVEPVYVYPHPYYWGEYSW